MRLEAARRSGCEVECIDPESGFLWVVRRDGIEQPLLGGLSPLNGALGARLAQDKSHTLLLAARAGFRTPRSVRCLRPDYFSDGRYPALDGVEPGLRFADEHGWPVVVKPNAGARGRDIVLAADEASLRTAIEQVWQRDYLALVQTAVAGIDLRIDLLDGELLFAYLRRPVLLVGDGKRDLRALLTATDRRFGEPEILERLIDDPIWRDKHVTLDHVPGADERIDFATLILNLNRLCVGERLDTLPDAWLEHTRRAGALLGLRHFGIDWRIREGERGDLETRAPSDAVLLEINASPSLAHMAATENREAAIEAEMKVVEALFAGPR